MSREENYTCKLCGKCCFFEIPITILDIHRIGKYIGINDEGVFKRNIQNTISEKSELYKISKKNNSACIFLENTNKCSIHNAKPNVCTFYTCFSAANDDILPWTSNCTDPSNQAKLWEQSIASMVTKKYINKNGTRWNENDYHRAVESIYNNIVNSETQRLKLARNENQEPIGILYDCSECKSRGECAIETPITLDDIRRILPHLNINWKNFFAQKIDFKPSSYGILKLKREIHCIFFDLERHCTIAQIRPMHCRFTPCPKKVKSNSQFDCFYLGSGTIEEQFRHQIATVFTQEYTFKYDTKYFQKGVDEALENIDIFASNHLRFEEFCKKISSFRYIDDTLNYIIQQEKNKEIS